MSALEKESISWKTEKQKYLDQIEKLKAELGERDGEL